MVVDNVRCGVIGSLAGVIGGKRRGREQRRKDRAPVARSTSMRSFALSVFLLALVSGFYFSQIVVCGA